MILSLLQSVLRVYASFKYSAIKKATVSPGQTEEVRGAYSLSFLLITIAILVTLWYIWPKKHLQLEKGVQIQAIWNKVRYYIYKWEKHIYKILKNELLDLNQSANTLKGTVNYESVCYQLSYVSMVQSNN